MWFDSPRGFDPVFRFNDESGELRANGTSVWLTEREGQVFLELLRRPGEVIDHGTLPFGVLLRTLHANPQPSQWFHGR